MPVAWKRLTLPGLCAAGLLLLAVFLPPAPAVSVVTVLALTLTADQLRGKLFPAEHPLLAWLFSLLGLVAASSIVQTVFYYFGLALGPRTDLVSVALAVIALTVAAGWKERERSDTADEKAGRISWKWALAALLPAMVAAAFILRGAMHAATTEAIRTPWPLLPAGTLAAFAVLTLATWLAAKKSRSMAVTLGLAALGLLCVSLISILVYRLGFGFDGFLHRASEQILAAAGTLNPKPPYYIGQYVFVTWLSRLLQLPLAPMDVLLVPLGLALIPCGLLFAFAERQRSRLALAALFGLLPLSAFVATTPQSFAYLLGLLALLLLLGRDDGRATAVVPFLLGGWALATHPLAGLPFFAALLAVFWAQECMRRERAVFRSPVTWLLVVATVVSVPAAFFFTGLQGHTPVAWDFSPLGHLKTYLDALVSAFVPPKTHVSLWPDWASFVGFLFLPALAALAIAAWRDRERRPIWLLLTLLGFGMVLAGFLLRLSGDFTFLIDYERGNYADRLFLVAALFWLAPALAGAAELAASFARKSATNIAASLLFVAAWNAGNAYLALPRHDVAVVGHGWSVSQADVDAVHAVDEDAAGRPYVVLADQSVSAAAVEAFGFKRYVTNPDSGEQIFYYPIPTGGPLYAIFLRAVGTEFTRQTVREAARLGQTNLVYVVLDNYWWNADDVGNKLGAVADGARDIAGGTDRVYRFDFSSSTKR